MIVWCDSGFGLTPRLWKLFNSRASIFGGSWRISSNPLFKRLPKISMHALTAAKGVGLSSWEDVVLQLALPVSPNRQLDSTRLLEGMLYLLLCLFSKVIIKLKENPNFGRCAMDSVRRTLDQSLGSDRWHFVTAVNQSWQWDRLHESIIRSYTKGCAFLSLLIVLFLNKPCS